MRATQVMPARMRASRLTGDPLTTPQEVVANHLAMQAQDYVPAKWSIGQRAVGFHHQDVDAALEIGSIIRTHVLRPTWHFVARKDVRWLLSLTGPRIQKATTGRLRQLGLDARTLRRSEKAVARALEGGARLTRKEVAATLEASGVDVAGQRLPHILGHCELEAVICSGGLQGKQQTFALLDERVPTTRTIDRETALMELVARYLRGHGPATVKDICWWSTQTVASIKGALDQLGSKVRSEEIGGLTFWNEVGLDKAPRPRGADLLHVYDELLVGYTESRYFNDARAADARNAWMSRDAANSVLLINGRLAGNWRRVSNRDKLRIETTIYDSLSATAERSLRTETTRFGRFFGVETLLR